MHRFTKPVILGYCNQVFKVIFYFLFAIVQDAGCSTVWQRNITEWPFTGQQALLIMNYNNCLLPCMSWKTRAVHVCLNNTHTVDRFI